MKATRALTLFIALALLALVLLALPISTARAAAPVIVRVKVNGATSGSCGGTWETACGLQYALTSTLAITGTELWVAVGTYTPTAGTDRSATFQLRDNIALYGGFAMTETVRSQRNFMANVTILSGDLNGNDNNNAQYDEPTRAENAYHVVTGSGVTNTAVLDGFTIVSGNANDTYYPRTCGGGMYNLNGSPTLTHVTFVSNSAGHGGGMCNDSSDPMLSNITFSGNAASTGGGGMANWNDSGPMLTHATFASNSAPYGGAMFNSYNSNPTLSNATFVSNMAAYHGGGVFNTESSPILTNTAFVSNTASSSGGAIYNYGSSPTLTNLTFSGNSATWNGGGMINWDNSSPTIRNTVFWGNIGSEISNQMGTPAIFDSVVEGGCPAGSTCTNIITADPRLGVLGNYGGNTETIPLLPGSSAIDAGNNATCASTDQRGKPRVGTCDIGAFEFQGLTLSKTSGDNQSTPIDTTFAAPLAVTLRETGSPLPLPGMTVAFTAPSSGPSAAWSGSLIQTATTNLSGLATVSPPTANGTLGSYAVTANVDGPVAPVTFALSNIKASTTTVITSSADPVAVGRPVTFTVTVSAVAPASTTPTGTVELSETSPAAAAVRATRLTLASQPLVNGVATFSVLSLTPGAHTYLASYGGDATHNSSTSAIYTQNVSLLYDYLPLIRR